jgi:hypothetical protein
MLDCYLQKTLMEIYVFFQSEYQQETDLTEIVLLGQPMVRWVYIF